MGFKEYVMQGIDILKLDSKAINKAAKDPDATKMALLFIAIAGVASAIGAWNFVGIIFVPIITVIMAFVSVGVLHLLAKLFGGSGSYMELFRPLGIAEIIMWITVIPFIGPILGSIVGIWFMVAAVVIIREVHKLSTGKAIMVVLIPVIVVMLLLVVGIIIAGVAFFSMMGGNTFMA
ncbi:YIP1 family protein [Candidatus Woesearchaeota archaeon]|nr:YIP1 family protein [Candidatus Woesearchaeota archaeon]